MLVRAHDEAGHSLSDEQLLAHVNILLVAGHETTTTLGAWVLYLLAEQPEYAARIDAELSSVVGDGPLTSESLHRCRCSAPRSARLAGCIRQSSCCRAACCQTSSSPATR